METTPPELLAVLTCRAEDIVLRAMSREQKDAVIRDCMRNLSDMQRSRSILREAQLRALNMLEQLRKLPNHATVQ